MAFEATKSDQGPRTSSLVFRQPQDPQEETRSIPWWLERRSPDVYNPNNSVFCKTILVVVGKGEDQASVPIPWKDLHMGPTGKRYLPGLKSFEPGGSLDIHFTDYDLPVGRATLAYLVHEDGGLWFLDSIADHMSVVFFLDMYQLASAIQYPKFQRRILKEFRGFIGPECESSAARVREIFQVPDVEKLVKDEEFVAWVGPLIMEYESRMAGIPFGNLGDFSVPRLLRFTFAYTRQLQKSHVGISRLLTVALATQGTTDGNEASDLMIEVANKFLLDVPGTSMEWANEVLRR